MRGEHGGGDQLADVDHGSSPHAWGAWLSDGLRVTDRFIPTCVGSIPVSLHSSAWTFGSSPHAWGASGVAGCRRSGRSVHPHMRGEHGATVTATDAVIGSSPHAWGAFARPAPARFCPRFIPTCVGSMLKTSRVKVWSIGSSPHAWGACYAPDLAAASDRFIPTCVGSMPSPPRPLPAPPVHPHMRGEHTFPANACAASGGSSPHAWGALHIIECRRRRDRFIPTCVGSIGLTVTGTTAPAGSSPHAWGASEDRMR